MCEAKTCEVGRDSLDGLRGLYIAIRDNHRGKLPPELQTAYDKAGRILKKAIESGCLDAQSMHQTGRPGDAVCQTCRLGIASNCPGTLC